MGAGNGPEGRAFAVPAGWDGAAVAVGAQPEVGQDRDEEVDLPSDLVGILFFDEPTSGLDFKNMNRVAKMLKELSKEKTIIVISHDNEFLNLACTRIVSLSR